MSPLRQAWLEHLHSTPRARTLDVAHALGVTEAELLQSRVGNDAVRLRADWSELLHLLPALGRVLCLTRNAHVVHERHGAYEQIRLHGPIAGVFGTDIDQRLILNRWSCAIAAPVETARGVLRSLQFFDTTGTAALKIYARESTDLVAWQALIDQMASPEPDTLWIPEVIERPATLADDAVDVAGLQAAWSAMTDTHQAHGLLRRYAVGREQALRLVGPEWAEPVQVDALDEVLQHAADTSERIMVFANNAGCIQIHSGLVHKIVRMDAWLNVLDPDFNLHVRTSGLTSVYIVRKPTDRGLVWSMECFGADGDLLLQLFGERTEAQSQRPSWHSLLRGLTTTHRA